MGDPPTEGAVGILRLTSLKYRRMSDSARAFRSQGAVVQPEITQSNPRTEYRAGWHSGGAGLCGL